MEPNMDYSLDDWPTIKHAKLHEYGSRFTDSLSDATWQKRIT